MSENLGWNYPPCGPRTGNQDHAGDVESGVKPHSNLGAMLLVTVVAAGACSSSAGRASVTTPESLYGRVQKTGTVVNLNIKATVTQRDNGRALNVHVGDGVAVGITGNVCTIAVDPPNMLAFYAIPTPSNWLYLHAVKPGRGALVARGSCKTHYNVTIVVS